jgi:hypothetical protein
MSGNNLLDEDFVSGLIQTGSTQTMQVLTAIQNASGAPLFSSSEKDTFLIWDMRLVPGLYRFRRIQVESHLLNFFAIGTIPNALQPVPIAPSSRFRRPGPGGGDQGMLTNFKNHDPSPFEFRIEPGMIIRVEAWSYRLPEQANPNQPPPGERWVVLGPNENAFPKDKPEKAGPGGKLIAQLVTKDKPPVPAFPNAERHEGWSPATLDNLGPWWPCFIRRAVHPTEPRLDYAMEDGVDGDFNDLVVELTRIGD